MFPTGPLNITGVSVCSHLPTSVILEFALVLCFVFWMYAVDFHLVWHFGATAESHFCCFQTTTETSIGSKSLSVFRQAKNIYKLTKRRGCFQVTASYFCHFITLQLIFQKYLKRTRLLKLKVSFLISPFLSCNRCSIWGSVRCAEDKNQPLSPLLWFSFPLLTATPLSSLGSATEPGTWRARWRQRLWLPLFPVLLRPCGSTPC